ncbi:MAG: o-succinylbenzoate synthase [Leptolyngbyaceae cyanobacterium bins.59]|nr:o-succinylbenzoate synthase [Leptolyngbyaceae cyanobacterium bins.59]
MCYRVELRPYYRQFKRPLTSNHGVWTHRQGIIIKLTNPTGKVGFAEIAPLPWFGSESFEEAWQFCQTLTPLLYSHQILTIPDSLPACQFGLESAYEAAENPHPSLPQALPLQSALLPTGPHALQFWRSFFDQGHRTFKVKIGVAPLEEEIGRVQQLLQAFPPHCLLRLDANGGLTPSQARIWLEVCDRLDPPQIEFLEQPLPVAHFDTMLDLSHQFRTLLALDESVANLKHLQTFYQQGWRDVFVIKPAIIGSPRRLREFCQQNGIDAVFSSVLETAIGQRAGLRLAAELSQRVPGYGVNHWFEPDGLGNTDDFEQVWQRL